LFEFDFIFFFDYNCLRSFLIPGDLLLPSFFVSMFDDVSKYFQIMSGMIILCFVVSGFLLILEMMILIIGMVLSVINLKNNFDSKRNY